MSSNERERQLSFQVKHLLFVTGLLASALGLFGPLGIFLAVLMSLLWYGVFSANISTRSFPTFSEVAMLSAVILLLALVLPILLDGNSIYERNWGRYTSLVAFTLFTLLPAFRLSARQAV